MIGSDYTTGDGLSLGVSLVLLEIPDEAWIRRVLISAFNTLTIEENWNDDYGAITTDQATRIMSLMLQTLTFDYEPPTMIPVGATMTWHTPTPPTGWLLCDGGIASASEWPDLFAVWGYTYGGSGDDFGLLDMADFSPMGVGGAVGLDDVAGDFTHTLTTGEMPSHTHTVNDPGHFHRIPKESVTINAGVNVAQPAARTDNPATPNMVTDSKVTGITINANGSGLPHNILHPVRGVYWIVYGGVQVP